MLNRKYVKTKGTKYRNYGRAFQALEAELRVDPGKWYKADEMTGLVEERRDICGVNLTSSLGPPDGCTGRCMAN